MELEAVEVVITPAGPGNDGLVVLVVIGVALDSIEGMGDVADIVANAGNLVLDGLLIDDDFLQDERELFGDDELSMETVPRPGSLLEQIDPMRRDDEDCQFIAVNEACESEKHRRKGLLTALSQLVRILAPVLMASSFATNLRPMEVRP